MVYCWIGCEVFAFIGVDDRELFLLDPNLKIIAVVLCLGVLGVGV
jgi:hypothetical protein